MEHLIVMLITDIVPIQTRPVLWSLNLIAFNNRLPSCSTWRPLQPCSSPARRARSACSRPPAGSSAGGDPPASPCPGSHWLGGDGRNEEGRGINGQKSQRQTAKNKAQGAGRQSGSRGSFRDDGFNRWESKITWAQSYGRDTMWLQSITRLIKQARRWARVNGIFSRKEIGLIL